MNIYLPIAEISVNIFVLLGLGLGVGVLSGIFGVGGGFLMTPMLIFLGIPPAIAVGTEANQILASSTSGVLGHWRRGGVDIKMGSLLMAGGLFGSSLGVLFFTLLKNIGQIDFFIRVVYVLLLFSVSSMMLAEGYIEYRRGRLLSKAGTSAPRPKKKKRRNWTKLLPFKTRFRTSRLYISALLPLAIGSVVGVLAAMLGIGGGFVMIPAMIYILRMPPHTVTGTSLFQIIFVTANATFLQAGINHAVDIVLALLLVLGGVVGAQLGVRWGSRIDAVQFRLLLALIVLSVCFGLLWELVVSPNELFSITGMR